MIFISPVHESYDVGGRIPASPLNILSYNGCVDVRDYKAFRDGQSVCPVSVIEQCYFESVFFEVERVFLLIAVNVPVCGIFNESR